MELKSWMLHCTATVVDTGGWPQLSFGCCWCSWIRMIAHLKKSFSRTDLDMLTTLIWRVAKTKPATTQFTSCSNSINTKDLLIGIDC